MILSEANKNVFKTVGTWAAICITIFLLEKFVIHDFLGNFIIENKVVYCTLLWITLSILWGAIEARYYLYDNTSSKSDNYNAHTTFTIVRGIVLLLILIIVQDWKSVLCLPFIFGFFHDGMYYYQRNKLDNTIYPKKWFDNSTTSTSWMDIHNLTGIWTRTLTCVIAITILIILNYGN